MRTIRAGLLLCAALALTAGQKPEQPIDPGPQPTEQRVHELGEAALVQSFFDPGSAQFQWPFGLAGGWYKPVLQRKVPGWWTCGHVNGKNRLGGYVGFRAFVVVVNNDRVAFAEVGDGSNLDFIAAGCQRAIARGQLPAAGTQAAVAPIPLDQPRFGFDFEAVPDGAYLRNVMSGGAAAGAGLTDGMVMSAVNGVSLKGFDFPTMAKLLMALPEEATFTIIGRGDVKVRKTVPSAEAIAAFRAAHAKH